MEMEKNPQQHNEATTIQVDIDKVATTLLEKMKYVSTTNKPNCKIYRVPEHLKEGNEKCYEPLSTSIGPVFYNKPELQAMQELKWMVLTRFRTHHDDDNDACRGYEPYIIHVRDREKEIRDCYQRQINLPSDEFIQMIVLDAAFMVSLLLQGVGIPNDMFRVPFRCLKQDLFVEENQLPFFVVKDVYDIACDNGVIPSSRAPFIDLALDLIRKFSTGFPTKDAIERIKDKKKIDASQISHLLHLKVHCCCSLHSNEQGNDSEEEQHLYSHEFYNVKQLTAAGVKFKLNDQTENLFDIEFNDKSGVLKLPKLTLADYTESVFRSILFFEQSHDYNIRYFADYLIFLDNLIDDVEDIRILQQNKILHNDLGCDKEAADLINKLNKYVTYDSSRFVFSKVHEELKDYASAHWNRWMTILRNKYFNHPWSIISVVAAIILFVLTLLQTITSFLQLRQD